MAIDDELKAQILRYHFVEHWRVGTIASQLGVHHSTVERVLGAAGVERERQRPRRLLFRTLFRSGFLGLFLIEQGSISHIAPPLSENRCSAD